MSSAWSASSQAKSFAVLDKYMKLSQGTIQAQYVWIGGSGSDLRCKTKTLVNRSGTVRDISELPEWNYDGSSTGQAQRKDSDITHSCEMYTRSIQTGR